MEVIVKTLNELTTKELLEIMQERVKVFIVEQNCPYQEVDEDDEIAQHVMLKEDGKLVGYTRIMDRGNLVTFGRVLVVKEHRAKKLGKKIVEATLEEIKRLYPNKEIKISAQNYLVDFYGSFGFEVVSEMYLEDDIPHIDMLMK